MKRCNTCNDRVWPWQKWGGVGPIGFKLRHADAAWHVSCVMKDRIKRHAERGCTSVCRLLGCPED